MMLKTGRLLQHDERLPRLVHHSSLVILFFLFPFFLFAQQIQPLWERTEPTDGTHDFYRLPIVLVDSSHNIIVCGNTYNPGPLHGFVTTKYDSVGNFLWQRRYDTPAHDYIRAASVDLSGAVYVGGITTNPFNNNATQFTVFKYSSIGDTLWQYWYGDYKSGVFSPSALIPDLEGNVLILSDFVGVPPQTSGMLAVKLDQNGNTIWEKIYNEGDYGYGGIAARRLGGRTVYWGRTGSPEGSRFFAWQIDDDGETIATSITEPYTDDFDRGYHIDDFGNLLIGDKGYEYKITKFNLDGSTGWAYDKPVIFPPPIPGHINLQSIATDDLGNVYVAGLHSDSLGFMSLTTKLSADGEFQWEHKMNVEGYNTIPRPNRLGKVSEEVFLVTGYFSTNPDSNFYELFLAFYDQNGVVKSQISDIKGNRNQPISIASDGNFFYIAGMSAPIMSVIEPDEQFLCKYALDDIIVATSSPGSAKVAGRLSVSPNPFYGNLRVSVHHEGENEQGLLEVHDPQGKVISSKSISLAPGENTLELEGLSNLPAGVYNISLMATRRVYVGQAIKAK